MDNVKAGMIVNTIDDRRLGTITALRSCCMTINLDETADKVHVNHSSVFNVGQRVTLMCESEGLVRYFCPIHTRARVAS